MRIAISRAREQRLAESSRGRLWEERTQPTQHTHIESREEGGEKSRGRFLCFIFFLFSCALFLGLIEAFVAFSLPRSSCPDSRDTIRYPIMALLNIPQRAVIARGQSMSRFGIKNEIRSEQYFFFFVREFDSLECRLKRSEIVPTTNKWERYVATFMQKRPASKVMLLPPKYQQHKNTTKG